MRRGGAAALLVAALAAALAGLLAACGPAPQAEGVVEVTFWHGMGGPLGKVLDAMIEEFNREHPGICVIGVNMGSYDTLQKKILASVVARRSPDISQNYEALTLKLARAGKLVCLDDLIERDGDPALRADIIPVLLEDNTFDGQLWSFPFNKSVPVLFYNRELFEAAGLDPQRPPRTTAELTDMARRLTVDFDRDGRPEQYGYAFTLRNAWNWECRFLQLGGILYDADRRQVFFDSPPAQAALQWNVDMVREGIAFAAEGYDHQNDFLARKVAMIETSVVSKVFMADKLRFDCGMAPIPTAGREAVILSGTNINIFDSGDQARIDGAWTFAKWFTSTENGVRWSLATTYLPVRRSSLESPAMQAALEADPDLRAPYAQLDHATFDPRIPEWFECRDKLSDALEAAVVSRGRVEEFLAEAQAKIEFILEFSLDKD